MRYCILIPFHNPIVWHTDYANQVARIVAKNHDAVCFLWADAVSVKEVLWNHTPYHPFVKNNGIWYYQPLYLVPGKRFYAVQVINMWLNAWVARLFIAGLSRKTGARPILWFFGFFDPVFTSLLQALPHIPVIYDCVDVVWQPNPKTTAKLKRAESSLISRAILVTANSRTLYRRLRPIRRDVHIVPLGFRKTMFEKHSPPLLQIPKTSPVVGYIGAIDYRLDYRLLVPLVQNNPQWLFVFVGPIFTHGQTTRQKKLMTNLLALPNVMQTSVPPHAIPSLLEQFDVTVIPYDIRNPFNRNAFPMKCMEYFYAQKPVIATPITELMLYAPFVRIAKTPDTWKTAIEKTLSHPMNQSEKRAMRRIAVSHTWERKIHTVLTILTEKERQTHSQEDDP